MTIGILIAVIVLLVWGHYRLTSVHMREMEIRLNEIESQTRAFLETLTDDDVVRLANERSRRRNTPPEEGPNGAA